MTTQDLARACAEAIQAQVGRADTRTSILSPLIEAALPVLVMAEKFVQGQRLWGVTCEANQDAIERFRAELRAVLAW